MPRRRTNGSQMGRSNGNEAEPSKKVASKGKKKQKSNPVFEEEYLQDSDEPGYDDRGNTESISDVALSDDVDSSSANYEEDEDADYDGQGSEDKPEQDKVSYQDLLIKLLREKVDKGKRKQGHFEKRTTKRGKLKVEKTKGDMVKEKGVVVKTQSRSTQKVFVPVLEVPQDSPDESHWWCLALHMRAQQLWMIDSMYPHPFATHAKEIDLLLSGIDVLFRLCDLAWKAGMLHSWRKCTVEILEPKDNSYCGVLMLACIKFFARRFTARFSVGTIPTARANMFLDDVQCEVNELKDCVGDVISGPRKTSRKL